MVIRNFSEVRVCSKLSSNHSDHNTKRSIACSFSIPTVALGTDGNTRHCRRPGPARVPAPWCRSGLGPGPGRGQGPAQDLPFPDPPFPGISWDFCRSRGPVRCISIAESLLATRHNSFVVYSRRWVRQEQVNL